MLLILAALNACSDSETNRVSGTRQQILHLGNGTEPQDLDPHTVTGVSNQSFQQG